MALGVTIDFNAHMGNITNEITRINAQLSGFQAHAEGVSNRINRALGALGVGLPAAGIAAIVAATGAFVKSGIDAADALNDMSLRTGIAVEKLSGFQLATEQSGTTMDAFVTAANKLNVEMGKNADGFAKLGINAKDPAEAMMQLADVLSGIEDPQKRAALGAKALGKGWAEMAPLLLQGGDGLRAAVKEGAELNGITTEMAQNADQFNDRLAKMTKYLGGAAAVIAGPLVEGFNELAAKMVDATEKGVTLDNVLQGIADYSFDQTTLTGVAGELSAVNRQIDEAEKKMAGLKNGSGDKWSMSDSQKPIDIGAEQQKLDAMYKQQEALYAKLTTKKAPLPVAPKTNQKSIDDFMEGGTDKPPKETGTHVKQKKEVKDLALQFDELIAKMERENALHGETKRITELQYDIQKGMYKDATHDQQIKLQDLAYETDALDRLAKKQDALAESARAYGALKFDNQSLIQSDNVQSGFNAQLANNADALNAGDISQAQFKAEMDKLSQAYNADFIDPAKKGTDVLTEYAVQAARNMESAFADFLFDPFAKNSESMLDGFVNVVRQMASQAASAAIMKGLFGATGVKDGGGLAGSAFTALAGLFHSGGVVGQAGSTVSVNPGVFAGAPRYHSGGVAGLKPDEVPAILQKGELVISRKQMANAQSSGGDITVNTSVSVSGGNGDSNAMQGLGNLINSKIREVLVTEKRPGGILA